ncbi:MAG: hypothetical protein EA409_01985 [Saprospirales bacterium]|nr:MAG: hypothetical protein EA409_01985 [Saprospirales bacterium]
MRICNIVTFIAIVLMGYPFLSTLSASPQILDSLKRQLPYVASDTNKVWMLRDIAYYFQSEAPDSAVIFARRGFQLARTLNFYPGQIWNLYQEGLAYEFLNNVDTALNIYDRAIGLAFESRDDISRAKLYNIMGVAHYFDGNFTEAINNYSRGYSLSDSIGYNEGLGHALNNLGVIYRKQRRFDRALEIYNRSLEVKQMEKDTGGIIISQYNIGLSHSYLGNYEESLTNLLKALELAENYKDISWDKSHVEIAIGVAYYNLGEYDLAKSYLLRGTKGISNKGSAEYVSAIAYLGALKIQEGGYSEGMENIEYAWDIASRSGIRVLQRDVLKQRALSAEIAGFHDISTESWRKFSELNDEINSEASNWAVEEMNARFELQDKEMTIALQNLELEREKARKNRYLISGSFSLLLFLVSAVFLYFFWKQKEQLKIAFSQKEAALNKNDLLLREMHHRTKNNLQLLNSLLSLQERNTPNIQVQAALQSSRDSVGAISLLHHQLYQNDDFRKVAMCPYLKDLVNYFKGAFGLEERGININYHCGDITLDTDFAIPVGLTINELVTNSVKHAFNGQSRGTVFVSLSKSSDNKLELEVRDNGLGMKQANSFANGTGSELLRIFSQRFNASVRHEQLCPGTAVKFEMPLVE